MFYKKYHQLVRKQTSKIDLINGIVLDRNEKVSYFADNIFQVLKNCQV